MNRQCGENSPEAMLLAENVESKQTQKTDVHHS